MKATPKHTEDSLINAVSAESNAFVVDNQQFLHPTNENDRLRHTEAAIQRWFNSERWIEKKRSYTAKDVAELRCSIDLVTPSHYTSKKLHNHLRECQKTGTCSQTFGALDIVQAINMSKYLTSIYVSGWQCSSTSAVTHEPGPDFADYPMNTVPEKVVSLVKAQLLHDRRQNEDRARMTEAERNSTPRYDYICPMVADADAGFGGITSIMKLTKLFIESGVAGIHLEDQKHGVKKCGHMGGKVLVSTREHSSRLEAARLQADILGCELVIVARTDALSALYLDNNIDPVDQPFILGVVDPKNPGKLMTFPDAGREAILAHLKGTKRETALRVWNEKALDLSLAQARDLARELGFEFYFDWDTPRTEEGYYKVHGCVEFCVRRGREFSKYSDLIWMETPSPKLSVAQEFAEGVRKYHPLQMFAYNLSPSFNWDRADMSDEQIKDFVPALARMGFVWQFITLAGFHMDSLISEVFAREFSKNNMIAYVQLIQRQEAKEGVDQLTHQKWSGAELKDREMHLVTKGKSSTTSMQHGNTEAQFKAKL